MSEWLFFAFLTAILVSFVNLFQKKILLHEHAMEYSATLAVANAVVALPLFFFVDFSKIDFTLLVFVFFTTIVGAFALLFIAKSVRHMEVSSVVPLLALSPALSALISFFFLGETLIATQIFGIFLIILGAYVLEIKGKDVFAPIKLFTESKYVHYILFSLVLLSTLAVLERYILTTFNVEVLAYVAFAQLFLAFHFFIMMVLFHDGVKGIAHGFKKYGLLFFLVALFTVGYRYAQTEAFQLANVGLVLSIKRLSVLFVVIIGGALFHEHALGRKIIAVLIMLTGAFFVAL